MLGGKKQVNSKSPKITWWVLKVNMQIIQGGFFLSSHPLWLLRAQVLRRRKCWPLLNYNTMAVHTKGVRWVQSVATISSGECGNLGQPTLQVSERSISFVIGECVSKLPIVHASRDRWREWVKVSGSLISCCSEHTGMRDLILIAHI